MKFFMMQREDDHLVLVPRGYYVDWVSSFKNPDPKLATLIVDTAKSNSSRYHWGFV